MAQLLSFHLHEVRQITVQGLRVSQSSEPSWSVRWLRNAFLGESQNELIGRSKINPHFPAFSMLWEHLLQKLMSIHAIFFYPTQRLTEEMLSLRRLKVTTSTNKWDLARGEDCCSFFFQE